MVVEETAKRLFCMDLFCIYSVSHRSLRFEITLLLLNVLQFILQFIAVLQFIADDLVDCIR